MLQIKFNPMEKIFSEILTGEGGTGGGLLESMFVLFVRHDTVMKRSALKFQTVKPREVSRKTRIQLTFGSIEKERVSWLASYKIL
jgi:hypothetical protein